MTSVAEGDSVTKNRVSMRTEVPRRRFVDQSIIISGGASGIGAAAARAFGREGGRIAILDVAVEQGRALAAELRAEGAKAAFFELDLACADHIAAVLDEVQENFGAPDVLFNHAGVVSVATVEETTREQLDHMLNVNVRATFLVCQHAVRAMARAGGGAIVISSSIGATHAFPLESVYCMTKAAVLMLAKSIATEYRDRGIRANAVCPGFVRTGHGLREIEDFAARGISWNEDALRASQGRICEPEEVAAAVLYLASDEASFVNGVGLYIDNGWAAKG